VAILDFGNAYFKFLLENKEDEDKFFQENTQENKIVKVFVIEGNVKEGILIEDNNIRYKIRAQEEGAYKTEIQDLNIGTV